MQHLDDGRLQAWLDRDRSGISEAEAVEIEDHVADCEVCAARLAELDEMSGRVRSLLAVAAPGGKPAPDFDDVVRRSRRGRPTGGGGRRWMAAGWAASFVAAIGLGWLSHDLVRLGPAARAPAIADGEGMLGTAELPPLVLERREAPASGGEARDVPATEGEGTGAPATEAEPAPRVLARAEPEQAPAETPPPAATDADPDVRVAPTTFHDAPMAAAEIIEAQPGPLRVHGQVRGADGRPLASVQVWVPDAAVGTLTGQDGTFSLFLPGGAVGADPQGRLALTAQLIGFRSSTLEVDPGARDSVSVDFRLEETALALDEIVVMAAPRTPAGRFALAEAGRAGEVWVPLTRAGAESVAGFVLLTVPGLPVLEVEVGQVEGQVAVRVRQELESGSTLTLVQQRADGPVAEPTLPEGQPVATVRKGDLRVTGSAPIPLDSLRALLEAVARP